ncbi:hypothetical protein LINGRAHAP2_LOCUS7642 [Linum grandiflorum]
MGLGAIISSNNQANGTTVGSISLRRSNQPPSPTTTARPTNYGVVSGNQISRRHRRQPHPQPPCWFQLRRSEVWSSFPWSRRRRRCEEDGSDLRLRVLLGLIAG